MRCSVVFGITLRLLDINISSSPPAINTAAYYRRCVITSEMVAVVHRRLCLQHLACCSVNSGSQARCKLRIAISAYPTCIRPPPLGGFPLEYCYAVWHGTTRMAWLPDSENFLMICLFILTQLTNVTDRHTHTQTPPHDGIGRAYAQLTLSLLLPTPHAFDVPRAAKINYSHLYLKTGKLNVILTQFSMKKTTNTQYN